MRFSSNAVASYPPIVIIGLFQPESRENLFFYVSFFFLLNFLFFSLVLIITDEIPDLFPLICFSPVYPLYGLSRTSLILAAALGPISFTFFNSSVSARIIASTEPKCKRRFLAAFGPIFEIEEIRYSCCSTRELADFFP